MKKFLWAVFLLALPVTSFPYFPPAIGGDALVRPLSLFPLIILIPFFVLPRLFRQPLPKTLLPVVSFVFIAMAASLLSLLSPIEPALGISIAERTLRGLITLGIGCAFYLTVALLPETIADLHFTLRWGYAGCALAMAWGSVQASQIISHTLAGNYNVHILAFLENVQRFISTRRLLYDRISGMTYEPHWFADQLILLALPGTLAAALTGYSIYRWRKGSLSIEWLLLGWIVILLPFTYSRAGLLNLVVTILLSVLLFGAARKKALAGNGVAAPKNNSPVSGSKRYSNTLRSLWQRLIQITLVTLALAAPIYLVGVQNEFFARLWKFWRQPDAPYPGSSQQVASIESSLSQTLISYFGHLGFDTRLAYGEAAYKIYSAHPWLGVGLGNFAFYIQDTLPLRPLTTEVLRAITPNDTRIRLVTPKNFYLRLLAETGIIGASAFIAFIIASLGCALYLFFSPELEWRYWGLTSLIGIIAFLISALTFDSFVIPNTWFVFGLCLAASRVYGNSTSQHKLNEPDTL